MDLSGSNAVGKLAYHQAATGSSNNLAKSRSESSHNVNAAAQQAIQDLLNFQAEEVKGLQSQVEVLNFQIAGKNSQLDEKSSQLSERDNEILNLKVRIEQYESQTLGPDSDPASESTPVYWMS